MMFVPLTSLSVILIYTTIFKDYYSLFKTHWKFVLTSPNLAYIRIVYNTVDSQNNKKSPDVQLPPLIICPCQSTLISDRSIFNGP